MNRTTPFDLAEAILGSDAGSVEAIVALAMWMSVADIHVAIDEAQHRMMFDRRKLDPGCELAWVSLTNTGGVNRAVPVIRKGSSVIVEHGSHRWRFPAVDFDRGNTIFRHPFAVERWSERAERKAAEEADWQS